MSDDVSRETDDGEHDRTPEHQAVEREEPQRIYNPHTKTSRPVVVQYRADGCVTWREDS